MARPLRIEFAGALYHVTSRGNERRPIFRCDRDRRTFLLLLGMAAKRFRWSIPAWVLMTNHFHLVIQTMEPNLSRGMHWLNGSYAAWFNRVHRRSGHLFQGRFHSVMIEKETYFEQVLRYVVRNPVRARIARHVEEYRWSSYRATAGLEKAPGWLDVGAALAPFGGDNPEGRTWYQAFVAPEVVDRDRLWAKVTNAIYLGSEAWTRRMREHVESRVISTDVPLQQRAVGRPTMADIIDAVARTANVSRDVVRSRSGGPLRRLAAWLGWHDGLLTLRSIAAALRLRSESAIGAFIRRCDRELAENAKLLDQLDASVATLRRGLAPTAPLPVSTPT